jgi:hypothetical protein
MKQFWIFDFGLGAAEAIEATMDEQEFSDEQKCLRST